MRTGKDPVPEGRYKSRPVVPPRWGWNSCVNEFHGLTPVASIVSPLRG